MTDTVTFSRPYAEAAYKVASEAKDFNKWEQNLLVLSHVILDVSVKAIIASPKISSEVSLKFLTSFLEHASDEFRNFLQIMIENKKIYYIDEVYRLFRTMILDSQNTTVAEVQTAFPLSDSQKKTLTSRLENKYGKKIYIDEIINKELLAGIKISVDNEVTDHSIRYKLNSLREQITTNR